MEITAAQWKTLVEGLRGVDRAVKELFEELEERGADWGILNSGLCAKDRALAVIKAIERA